MVKVSEIRQRIATAAKEADWNESRSAFELFPNNDYRQILHRGFTVGVTQTTPLQGDRQRLVNGVPVHTDVVVRYSYRLRADGPLADYDSGLDAEEQLIADILKGYDSTGLNLTLNNSRRQVIPLDNGVYLLGEISFTAHHRLALS